MQRQILRHIDLAGQRIERDRKRHLVGQALLVASTPIVPITLPLPSSDRVTAVPSVRVRPDAALLTVSANFSAPLAAGPSAP